MHWIEMARRSYEPPIIRDLDVVLDTYTSYTEPRSRDNRTIFGAEEDGLGYDYDDRFEQWDYKKSQEAKAHADGVAIRKTAAWFQAYLSFFYGYPVEVRHILAGCNRGNGWPYLVFGSRKVEKQ